MQTIESLKRKIKSTSDLLSVVKTMKALAAVSIRQYQKAVESLKDYHSTVEMGLQVVMKKRAEQGIFAGITPINRIGAIIFGSDQGLCGQLNAQIASFALEEMDKLGVAMDDRTVLIGIYRVPRQSRVDHRDHAHGPGHTHDPRRLALCPADQPYLPLLQ